VASTPSAEDHLTTPGGVDKTSLAVNMQVSTPVTGPRPHRSAGGAESGTATGWFATLNTFYLSDPVEPGILTPLIIPRTGMAA
jgi:hypothetical protein